MSEQTPTNISNADFTFKDKYGNTGSNKGLSADDGTKLNNMVKLMNLILQTPNSADFINTLASKDFTNIDNTAKIAIAHNAMPSDVYDYLTPAVSTPYTAPADGYVIVRTSGGNQASVAIRIGVGYITNNFNTPYGGDMHIYAPVKKGEVFYIDVNLTTVQSILFVYAVGSESEQ